MISSRTLNAAGAAILGTLVGTGPAYAQTMKDATGRVVGKAIYAMETLSDGRAATISGERYYTLSGAGGALTFRLVGGLVIPAASTPADRRITVTFTLSNMVFTTTGAKTLTVRESDADLTTAQAGTPTVVTGGRSGDGTITYEIAGGTSAYTQDTVFELALGEVQMKLGAPGSVAVTVRRSDGISSGDQLVGAVAIESDVVSTATITSEPSDVTVAVAHDYERFRGTTSRGSLKGRVDGVNVSLKSEPANIRSSIDGAVITTLPQIISDELSRVGFSGDTTFLKAAFLDSSAGCNSTSGTINVLTDDNEWKTGRDRPKVTDVDGKYLCLEVDGETKIPDTDAYRATVDFTGISGAAFPPADEEIVLAGLTRDGSTVQIPYLTTFSGYNQRLVMRNRWNRAVPYTIIFQAESGITVDPLSVEGMLEPGTTMMRVSDLLEGDDAPATITGGNRTAATIEMDINPGHLDVATVQVNRSTGGTDTVVHD